MLSLSRPPSASNHFGGDSGLSWCDFARYIIDAGQELGMLERAPLITGIRHLPNFRPWPASGLFHAGFQARWSSASASAQRLAPGRSPDLLAPADRACQAGSLVS